MDIFLSGDIRKDKTTNGYVLNTNHTPNGIISLSGASSIDSGAQYYNLVLDAFDYSGNFIERKCGFYDRGGTGASAGIDSIWNNVGYSYNLYYSGSSAQFTGFSGITTTNSIYNYNLNNKYSFTLNGLPNYSGLTTTSATTFFGNVLIKDVSYLSYPLYSEDFTGFGNNGGAISTYGVSPFNTNNVKLFSGWTSGAGLYKFTNLSGQTAYTFSVYVKYVSGSGTIYFGCDSNNNLVTINTITGDASVLNGNPSNIVSRSYGNGWFKVSFDYTPTTSGSYSFVLYNQNTDTDVWLGYEAVIKPKNTDQFLIQYDVNNIDSFNMELSANNNTIKKNQNGRYNDMLVLSGSAENNKWVNFFIKSNSEVKLNNLRIFPVS